MYFCHLIRFALFVCVLGNCVRAQQPKSDFSPAEETQFKNLAQIFAPPGTPSIKGKPWVEVDHGPANWKLQTWGWLIEDSEKEVVILDSLCELQRFKKPRASDMRPQIEEGQKVPYAFQNPPVDRSVAWKVQPLEFPAMCQKFIEAGVPKDTINKDLLFKMINDEASQKWHVIEAARYAHFAHQAGHAVLSLDLVHEANRTIKFSQHQNYGAKSPPTLTEYVAEQLATRFRRQAIAAARSGTPRKELLAIWTKMAALPHHSSRAEAETMVRHYESLLAEDARWMEPDATAFAKLSPQKQAAYWLYHLRDLDVEQLGSPGVCHVLFEGRFNSINDAEKNLPHPALELRKLGHAALPLLIAHLDDARPTRCEAYWRFYSPDGRYLLRYGDCCQQIFEDITKHKISEETYPHRDSDGADCKTRAEKWWQDNQQGAVRIQGTIDSK